MNFNQDMVPSTLYEAIEVLYNSLEPNDIEYIKRTMPEEVHFSLGMFLRNNYSLWEPDSPLGNDIKERFGLIHGDDRSGLLLKGLWARVLGKDVDEALEKEAEKYKKHWINYGIDPLTQEPIPGFKPKTTQNFKINKEGEIEYE